MLDNVLVGEGVSDGVTVGLGDNVLVWEDVNVNVCVVVAE